MTAEGYKGSTTTPFYMMLANWVGWFDVAKRGIRAAVKRNNSFQDSGDEALRKIDQRVEEVRDHIRTQGKGSSH